MINYLDIAASVHLKDTGTVWTPPERLLALDPGETVGWSFFEQGELIKCGQLVLTQEPRTKRIEEMHKHLESLAPTEVVIEDYFVYAHKTAQHAWNKLFTAKLIGSIEALLTLNKVPYCFQTASQAKGFCKDNKLKAWKVYQTAYKHANDSIRHGIYYMIFGQGGISNVG